VVNTEALNSWLQPLIHDMSLGERKRLLLSVRRYLVQANRQRIQSQTDPDGVAFQARAPAPKGLRHKRGPMFTKLRTGKHLTGTSNAQEASIGFTGRSSFIARQHQEGLPDTSSKRPIHTPERKLLGISDQDEQHILDLVLTHFK